MKQITVDDEAYALAEQWAARQGMTVSEAVSNVLRDRLQGEEKPDPMGILGCMADNAEFLDQLVEEAMRDRRTHPMRLEETDFGND